MRIVILNLCQNLALTIQKKMLKSDSEINSE